MKREIRSKLKEQTAGYLTGALSLVAGLAWNEAIKGLIEILFPFSKGGGIFVKFFYAILITIIVVLLGQSILKNAVVPEKKIINGK